MNIKNKGAYILIEELNVTRFADGFNEVYTQNFEYGQLNSPSGRGE